MTTYGRREWLQLLRMKRQLTQAQVADALGVSLNYYQRIEYGERNPSPELAKKLAGFFHVPLERLYSAAESNHLK